MVTGKIRNWIPAAVAIAAFGVCAALIVGAGSTYAAARPSCANANAHTDEATVTQLRKSISCLVRKIRARKHRHRLHGDSALRKVAAKHTDVMVADDCFSHACRGEGPLRRRITKSGYGDAAARFGYAENTGCAPTPAAMLKAWLTSHEGHRQNLLGKRFRDFGVGVAKGAPSDCTVKPRWATYTLLVAWKQK